MVEKTKKKEVSKEEEAMLIFDDYNERVIKKTVDKITKQLPKDYLRKLSQKIDEDVDRKTAI